MSFVPNPQYLPHVEQAAGKALVKAGQEMRDLAKQNTSHGSVARTLWSSPQPTHSTAGPSVTIRYRKGLGPIFEGGTKQRFTKKGAARGLIQPGEFALRRARDSVLRRGLDLRLYL